MRFFQRSVAGKADKGELSGGEVGLATPGPQGNLNGGSVQPADRLHHEGEPALQEDGKYLGVEVAHRSGDGSDRQIAQEDGFAKNVGI